jgi:lysosomal acid lipase/cholesteryl ester hydrolase
MGNSRGNYYSRKHKHLNANADTAYWQFSWDEVGNFDLPAMIDYVLEKSGAEKLHYIGHSQGNTAFFVMASLRPEYNEKFRSMHAYAPVAYMAHNKNPLFLIQSPFANYIGVSLFYILTFLCNIIIIYIT